MCGIVTRIVADDDAANVDGRESVRERGGQHRSGADTRVDVQRAQVQALDAFAERLQRAQFVEGPERSAAGERDADASGPARPGR